MDDAQIIRCLKSGETDKMELLVKRYQIKALRVAFLITQDEYLAEDVVQDVFIHIFRRVQQFDETRPFEPYLMRSVVNAALNVVHREKRLISLDEDTRTVENLLARAVLVESQAEYARIEHDIISALSQLPPRERSVIIQRYYLEMTEKEMARVLESPPGTIKWLLNIARSHLRDLLHSERSAK